MPGSYVNQVKDTNSSTYNIQDARITDIPVQISAFPQSNSAIVTATPTSSFSTIEFGNAQATFLRNDGSWAIPPANLVNLYGICETFAGTINKSVSITGIQSLTAGLTINVKFTQGNFGSSNPTLNVNDLGSHPIKFYADSTVPSFQWIYGQTIQFVYDGSNWLQQDALALNLVQSGNALPQECAIITTNETTNVNTISPMFKDSNCTINHSTGTIKATSFSAATNMTISGKSVATQEYVMSMILSAMSSSY